MHTTLLSVTTGNQPAVHDLTPECRRFLRGEAEAADGVLQVFVPHATAGLALIELGSGSEADLLATLAELLPADRRWRHSHGCGACPSCSIRSSPSTTRWSPTGRS